MATTTACAAKWTATKLLVYTNVSNHASDALGAIDSGKVSSYLFAGAELDRLHERGEVPINPQLVPNLSVQVSILGEIGSRFKNNGVSCRTVTRQATDLGQKPFGFVVRNP